MNDQWPPPQVGQPGAGQPHPTGALTAKRSGGRGLLIGLLLAIVVALIALGALGFMLLRGTAAAADVALRGLGTAGATPFTAPVAPEPSATLMDFAERPPSESTALGETTEAGYRRTDGGVPGVFGGSLAERVCDKAQLGGFLAGEPEKAAAWAAVLSIDPVDIGPYLDGLTGVNLAHDTRVLDHGFVNGTVEPSEALLQRGTAVLIDSRGTPRVNCYSGNPLLAPSIVGGESYTGAEWSGFDRTLVIVVIATPVDRPDFELVDVASGETFTRPAGTDGEADGGPGETPDTTVDLASSGTVALGQRVDTAIAGEPELRFDVEAPSSSVIELIVDNPADSAGRVAVAVVDDGEQLTFFRVDRGASETFTWTLDDDGGGPIQVVFTEGPAEFSFVVNATAQNDAGQGGDAGDLFASAFEITSGQRVEGSFGNADTGDRFVVPVTGGQVLTFTNEVVRETGRAAFAIELNGDRLFFGRTDPGGTDELDLLLGPDDVGMLEVFVNEGSSTYAFTVTITDQQDGGQAGDASADLPEARPLDDVTAVVGEVGERDPGDLYLFTAEADELEIEVTVDPASGARVAVAVFGPDGDQTNFFRVEPGATVSEAVDATAGETHQLRVTEGRGTYSISIEP